MLLRQWTMLWFYSLLLFCALICAEKFMFVQILGENDLSQL